MGEIRFGTCSWKYPGWAGLVYSQPKGINYLTEYAQHYSTVEIDQWFWSLFGVDKVSLPRPEVVQDYVNSTPPEFRFTIKAPNSITLTHFYRKKKSDPPVKNPYFLSPTLFAQVLDTLTPMKAQIAALMFQFEYLNKQKMRDQYEFHQALKTFFAQVDRSVPYAIETRNPWYLNRRYFEFLLEEGLSCVFLEGYYMPPIVEVYNKHRQLIRGTTVIRLHGGDRKEIEEKSGEQWNRIWEDRQAELRAVVDMIKDLQSSGVDVYVNVNNHYEGSAPLTIRRLEALLQE